MSVVINGSAGVTTNSGAVYDSIQRSTAITLTNQTAPEFTGIPSWVRRITVMFNSVSTNGTSNLIVQLGDSGGVETTGYVGSYSGIVTGTTVVTALSASFLITASVTAATNQNGVITIVSIGSNTWSVIGAIGRNDGVNGLVAGAKTLSDTLDRVRITTANGTDQFDAGTINILFE
jgi:hypothetical protein